MPISKDKKTDLLLLLVFLSMNVTGLCNHELWGDEVHSWNLSKGSFSLPELFQNIRYEGHPPFWYLCLYAVTRFTHALVALKMLQAFFVACASSIVVFTASFSRREKIILLSGYYFLFEYSVFSRNYMPAIFFAFASVIFFKREEKSTRLLYYISLFLLSNVHLLGLLLAISIHTAFLLNQKKSLFTPGTAGSYFIFLPAIYFIFPPGDSQLNMQFWQDRWSSSQLYQIGSAFLRSFFPFPDVFNTHWWNTHLLLDTKTLLYRGLSFMMVLLLVVLSWSTVKRSRNGRTVFLTNTTLTFLLSIIFPLTASRYAGFLFVGFVIACAIGLNAKEEINRKVFLLLLILQVPGGITAYSKDLFNNFSSADQVVEMKQEIPDGAFVATDYWTLNSLSAFTDSAYYCIELKRKASFLRWTSEMSRIRELNYEQALVALVDSVKQPFYFFSAASTLPETARLITVTPIARSNESIEKSSVVFLYKVSGKDTFGN